MKLSVIEVKNFRSLKQLKLKFEKLAILIGENDAGKSSTLDLLEIALGNKRPDDNDFYCCDEEIEGGLKRRCESDTIEVILEFELDDRDDLARYYSLAGKLIIRKVWKHDSTDIYYWGQQIEDEHLAQDFTKLKKPELEALIQSLDDSATSNLKTNDERVNWLLQKAKETPKKEEWIRFTGKSLDFLPRFERYRAMDYSSPEIMVMKTLRQVYEQCIYQEVEDAEGNIIKQLDRRLNEVKLDADTKIKDKIQELKSFISRYAPQIKNISYESLIDFSGGLKSGEFQVDDGRGLHYLSKVGDGTKRRISMATLDWDRDISIQQASKGNSLPQIIRGYDEPDTNLHYEAQRLMYRAISDIADAPNSHIQIILCTHSLTMIDRASAKSINLLRLKDGCTITERLETDDDPSVEQFLSELAQELGITNTVMFYERCFILIEGETEAIALPILYHALYRRSLIEDGIRIINVKGNGATKEFLRLMGRNKQTITITFLDSDTKEEQRGELAKLTEAAFREAGFSNEFIRSRMLYIGKKEFEDAFSDKVIARSLNCGFPKSTGEWSSEEILGIRNDKKLSDSIGRLVHNDAGQGTPNWGKPEFGKYLGRVCDTDEMPPKIIDLFCLARQISGCS